MLLLRTLELLLVVQGTGKFVAGKRLWCARCSGDGGRWWEPQKIHTCPRNHAQRVRGTAWSKAAVTNTAAAAAVVAAPKARQAGLYEGVGPSTL